MQQTHDFLAESDALAAVLRDLPEADWQRPTQFKSWTINDVVVHLHFWNRAVDMALTAPAEFAALVARVTAPGAPGLRSVENAEIAERGAALFAVWQSQYTAMADRWTVLEPRTRIAWVGPDMSARSAITARQMETWAHGQEIFDLLGRDRVDADRIRNIVVLGVNTFGWSHKVHGIDPPAAVPRLRLTAPSGAIWTFGDDASPDLIEGAAVEFAQVVTQTRNIADTSLRVSGAGARRWMETAQCFAGPPETPPKPGERRVSTPA